MFKAFRLLIFIMCLPIWMRAQENRSLTESTEHLATDSLEALLLTCSPGTEVWQYYGHTALLIQSKHSGDLVFNYGLFDFRTPNFTWRFILGETDYTVGHTSLEHFVEEYQQRGSAVRAAKLNLSQEEIIRLGGSIMTECMERGWTYRYNFFYDNCATRIRDKIEQCIEGEVIYDNDHIPQLSLRDIIHAYSAPYKWSTFGQDLLIGAPADLKADRITQEFAPEILEQHLNHAQIKREDGTLSPLITEKRTIVEGNVTGQIPFKKGLPLSPFACVWILFLITVVLNMWDRKRRKKSWIFDLILLSTQGIMGCIITFMFLFSQHPTVASNALILLFNPLPLIFLYWTIKAERKGRPCLYHTIALVWITLFFLLSFTIIKQYVSTETYVLALCLLLRSEANTIASYRQFKSKNSR